MNPFASPLEILSETKFLIPLGGTKESEGSGPEVSDQWRRRLRPPVEDRIKRGVKLGAVSSAPEDHLVLGYPPSFPDIWWKYHFAPRTRRRTRPNRALDKVFPVSQKCYPIARNPVLLRRISSQA